MALRSFREGDKVKAVVLSADIEKRRISFGLKPSYFAEEDLREEESESEEDEKPKLQFRPVFVPKYALSALYS